MAATQVVELLLSDQKVSGYAVLCAEMSFSC